MLRGVDVFVLAALFCIGAQAAEGEYKPLSSGAIVERLAQPPASWLINKRYRFKQILRERKIRYGLPSITFSEQRIHFSFNSARIKPVYQRQLQEISLAIQHFLAGNPNALFLIEGHTDAVGADWYNEQLSTRRAASVASYLNQSGIALANLYTHGYGERELAVATMGRSALNRRVVIRRVPASLLLGGHIAPVQNTPLPVMNIKGPKSCEAVSGFTKIPRHFNVVLKGFKTPMIQSMTEAMHGHFPGAMGVLLKQRLPGYRLYKYTTRLTTLDLETCFLGQLRKLGYNPDHQIAFLIKADTIHIEKLGD